ncbi:MAG: hypothetical protein AAF367_17465 [Pseudomonadota bacterium]
MQLITDNDLQNLDIPLAAKAIGDFLRQTCAGETDAPPRMAIPLDGETLVITAGTDLENFGFRAYSHRPGLQRAKEDQIIACWDRETHNLKAIAVGERLGAWRTGILGGIAYQNLAGPGVETCGVIGSGLQAFTQVRAIAALAKPRRFLVFSRNRELRCAFTRKLESDTGVETIAVDKAERLVRQSDAIVTATNASEPVFELSWLDRCTHITTVGPKTRHRHEAPVEVATWADRIVSDSPQQIREQGRDHFLADALSFGGIDNLGSILDSDLASRAKPRTLYLSAGLAGTEVALLAAISAKVAQS